MNYSYTMEEFNYNLEMHILYAYKNSPEYIGDLNVYTKINVQSNKNVNLHNYCVYS